jgi:hypothetical protein
MQTPRPDRFTYPPHGDAVADPTDQARRPWMRAVFLGGLIGVAALGFALSLTS